MRTTFRFAVIAATLFPAVCIPPASAGNALDHGSLGLYDAPEFRAVDGRCPDCAGSKAALWYFEGDVIAIPRQAQRPLPDLPHGSVAEDIRTWMQQSGEKPATLPLLTWLGSPELLENAALDTDGKTIQVAGESQSFMPIAKIESNRSYFNADSVAFFSKRKLRMRGVTQRDGDNS